MKKLVLSFVVLGCTSLGFSQILEPVSEVALDEVTVIHSNYYQSVSEGVASPSVLKLESEVACYDITKSPVFNDKSDWFEVAFEQPNGSILATFDKEGKVIRTSERFNDITFPQAIRDEIYGEYPGWIANQNSYQVSYNTTGGIKRTYKVELHKDNVRKRLKIQK